MEKKKIIFILYAGRSGSTLVDKLIGSSVNFFSLGEIGLSNANSLGFKKGVTINEFSADDAFSDESGQAVPTERAVGNFINRALGFNVKSGAQIPGTSNLSL